MILIITDNLDKENPFSWASDYFSKYFEVVTLTDMSDLYPQIKKINPSLIISNVPYSIIFNPPYPVIIYLMEQVEVDLTMKRQLALKRKNVEIFSSNKYIAKYLLEKCQIKSRIQYPYIPDNGNSTNEYILHDVSDDVANEISIELPNEVIRKYEHYSDLEKAKIFIHGSKSHSRLLLATSYNVPSVTVQDSLVDEFLCRGDILLPPETNLKQLIQGVKVAMRDYNALTKGKQEGKKRYSNLDALVERVKKETELKNARAAKQPITPQPLDQKQLLQQRIAAKSVDAVIRRHQPTLASMPPITATFRGFQKTPYVSPSSTLYATPAWFHTNKPADVSIVIPMFNSRGQIIEQIKNWDMEDDNISKETIYVNDCCPQNSAEAVLYAWSDVKAIRDTSRNVYPNGLTYRIGKIVSTSHNSGYASACNVGAGYSTGKYLLFLNADTIVTPNWVSPMYKLMESDPTIGIVGNLQLKQNGTIDSAGSEWMWDSKSFDHVGRNVYNNKRLTSVMHLTTAPPDISQIGERDMVTGCCFMIRKDLFNEVGGFDVKYRIGYWEDADINMEVKSRGYKVYYQPESIIYHHTGHSGAMGHPYIFENARHFYQKWVYNNKIDSLVKAKKP